MTAATLDAVPPACRRRLIEHYGSAAKCWLATVPALLGEAAARWRLRLIGYHDAGCASTIALAHSSDERTVLLKAWYDRGRYAHEVAALRAWPPGRVPRVLHAADDLTIAALDLVGGRPGGSVRPPGEDEAVALGLAELHQTNGGSFPRLDDHIADVVLPRIDWRLRMFGGDVPGRYLEAIAHIDPDPSRTALLHADLYRENVPFDRGGRPMFVDPLPMVGDPTYDWAFWVVYYDLQRDPVSRLRLACAIGEVPLADLVPWCLTLCVDGLLYYREVGDPRAPRMLDVTTALAAYERAVIAC